jgi:hypothetical protein
MGPVLDAVVVSLDVEGASYKDSGDAYAHFYYAFLPRLWSPAALPPRLLHHGGYKVGDRSYTTYILLHDFPLSPSLLPYN